MLQSPRRHRHQEVTRSTNAMKILCVLLVTAMQRVAGVCYFPVEYQGIFATQSSVSSLSQGTVHQYSQVTILPDAIPVWGVCHTKFEKNVILRDSTGGEECFRCFHVSQHSGNVIQVYTEGLNKCYSSEAAALLTCPTPHAIKARRVSEIMLYKSRSFTQDGLIDRVFCPINGRFRFTYDVNDGTESSVECPEASSELSNCPRGSELQLRFRRCSFGELNMGLRCLGNWRGHDGQRYLALWDPAVTTHNQPRYRCAMYSVDEDTGKVFLSFSIDATCTNHLHSPWDGYETMVLLPVPPPAPPALVHTTACVFPGWTQGSWQHLQIATNELWLQIDAEDKKYRTLCLSQHAPHGERFALYSTNQCGEDEFTCIWIKKRAVNVIEFQIGVHPSDVYNATRICSDDVFRGQTWITQGRLAPENLSGCPITGEYTGVIPDATELCARLSSDCNDPQHMHYTVHSCANTSEVLEGAGSLPREGDEARASPPLHRTQRHAAPSRGVRHALRHIPRQLSWARVRAIELGWSPDEQFTTIGAKNRRRERPPKQVYVFPNASPPRPAAALPQTQTLDAPDASLDQATTHGPHSPATTRRPYAHEGPFYVLVGPPQPASQPQDDVFHSGDIEERDYRCLGQWSEGGVMYTFTHRRDVDTYECFAGVVVNQHEIFIIEAGTSCQRGLQPLAHGMKLVRQATCSEIQARTTGTTPPPNDPSSRPPWWPPTTKNPWVKKNKQTPMPEWNNEIPRAAHSSGADSPPSLMTSLVLAPLLILLLAGA